MAEAIFKPYLANLQSTLNQGDAREESFYEHIKTLLLQYAELTNKKKPDITILPKATEAGNPDFRVWDGTSTKLSVTRIAHLSKSARIRACPYVIVWIPACAGMTGL